MILRSLVNFAFLILIPTCFFLSGRAQDGMQQVIDNAVSPVLKDHLVMFAKEGTEKTPDHVIVSVDSLLKMARSFLGTPARYGGNDKTGIDCSGFVRVVFKKYGVELPHSAQGQARFGKVIATQTQLQPGDLVFFYNSYSTRKFITHSGIYVGKNRFIHVSDKKGVVISEMDNRYWKERYLFATRLSKKQ